MCEFARNALTFARSGVVKRRLGARREGGDDASLRAMRNVVSPAHPAAHPRALATPLALALLVGFALGCARPSPHGPEGPDGPAEEVVLAGLRGVAPRLTDPSARPLNIASWNIESFPQHDRTIEEVAALVIEHELDLVGVQEITDPDAFGALADLLPDHEMVVSFDSWAFTRVGFLYRADRIAVGDVERLFRRETFAFPRDPLMAQLSVLDDDGEIAFDFTFVVVHLKARGDEESRQRRIAAIEALDAWIRERILTEPDVMVIGDFNDQLTDGAEWNVFGPMLDAPELYTFLTLAEELRGGHSYIPYEKMIDHILVTNDTLIELGGGESFALEPETTMADYEEVISDHRPVLARFEL